MNKKKLLVTGNCGFIFSNFVRSLAYKNAPYDVVGVDLVSGNANSLYYTKGHTFYIADIRDQHIMDRIFQFEMPDIVIHGAAETHVDNSLHDPNSFITSNVLGTQVIINCCLKYKVEKLMFISSDEVFGQLTNENDPPWKESDSINPRNPYSASKAAGELLVKAAHQSHGLIYNITRSSNNYGPRQTPDKLIPKVIKCIIEEKKIPVYGQGLQIRDWTHVYDNCDAILTLLEKAEPNEIYNISANQEMTNIEVVQKICNVIGKGYELLSFVAERPGHDFRYSIDTSKIRKLGWNPRIKFPDGIVQCVEWYLKNKWMLSVGKST